MITQSDVRARALALPEAEEQDHFGKPSFRVRGKIFATLPPDGRHLHVFLDEPAVRMVVANDPEAFEELRWGARLAGVRIRLAAARPAAVRDLLFASWRRKAPKSLTR